MINLDANFIRKKILCDLKDPLQETLYSIKVLVEHNARFNRLRSFYVFEAPLNKELIQQVGEELTRSGFKLSFKKSDDKSLLIFIIDLY
jgi:hypothetical protein